MENKQNFTLQNKTQTLFSVFSKVPDPRRTSKGNLRYPLDEILFLIIAAVLCGMNTNTGICFFGKNQLDWLRKYFPYKNGIPSHDALGSVLSLLDTKAFAHAFTAWVSAIAVLEDGEVIAIDGKCICGSFDTFTETNAVHIVSAFAAGNQMCLGQSTVDKKSNEITAIPKLLDLIAVKGCIITIDAMGCQKEITAKIAEKEADYILAVKGNQPDLLAQVKKTFNYYPECESFTDITAGHGRIEKRTCSIIKDLRFLDGKEDWTNLNSIIRIVSERTDKLTGVTTYAVKYYISNLLCSAEKAGRAVRKHWAVENTLHWSLDVTYREDASRCRTGNSAANFNLAAKFSMAMLKKDPEKISIALKRYKACFSQSFRDLVLEA